MIKEIIISIVSGLIGTGLTLLLSKIYFGYKHFGGIKKTARLNKDCYNAGIVNFFPDRKAYIQHKDHGKSNEYISRANHSVLYVGYWLATATEIGELTKTISDLLNNQITVTLVFISPDDKSSLEICSKYIGIRSNQIATRVKDVIKNLLDFKNSLTSEQSKYLVIKIHNIPLSTTAFIIDHSKPEECKILLDYKIYNGSRENSYGVEFKNSKRSVTNKLLQSYLSISKSAVEINDKEDLHKHDKL